MLIFWAVANVYEEYVRDLESFGRSFLIRFHMSHVLLGSAHWHVGDAQKETKKVLHWLRVNPQSSYLTRFVCSRTKTWVWRKTDMRSEWVLASRGGGEDGAAGGLAVGVGQRGPAVRVGSTARNGAARRRVTASRHDFTRRKRFTLFTDCFLPRDHRRRGEEKRREERPACSAQTHSAAARSHQLPLLEPVLRGGA